MDSRWRSAGARGAVLLLSGLIQSCGAVHGSEALLSPVRPHQQALAAFEPGLGVGVNEAETKTFGQCVTTPLGPKITGFASRLYDELAVRSRSELNTALNVDAAVSARGAWGSAGGSASYFKGVKMTSEGFYWLVHAEYRSFDQPLDMKSENFHLTEAARTILAGPGGFEAFRRACGDAFYSGLRRGARYALLYEFVSEEKETIEQIKAKANYGGWGVQAKAEFESLTQMAQKASVLKVHAESAGGGVEIESYATSPEHLERQLFELRRDLEERGQGEVIEYFATDYDVFPEIAAARQIAKENADKAEKRLSGQARKAILRRLYGRFSDNVDMLQRIDLALRRARGPEPIAAYSSTKRYNLLRIRNLLETQNGEIEEQARRCLDDDESSSACACGESGFDVAWDSAQFEATLVPDQDFTTLQGWELLFSQTSHDSTFLDVFGFPPEVPGQLMKFKSPYLLADTPQGVLAHPLLGPEAARLIGWAGRVPDPHGRQLRPNICVYNTQHVCSLRIVPLAAPMSAKNGLHVKLQLVFFDEIGLVERKTDLPIAG